MAAVSTKSWRPLRAGDIIDIIAPAAGSPSELLAACAMLRDWQLVPRVLPDQFGQDLLCANTDSQRFKFLQQALLAPDSAAIWCLRGGYGSTRLMADLLHMPAPDNCKLFIGMSDITALHIVLQQYWHWPTLHGPCARNLGLNILHPAHREEIKKLILGQYADLIFSPLIPFNKAAQVACHLVAPIVGGNLCLIQASIGTAWQLQTKEKILFLEEVNERGYQVDRILQHLLQAGLFQGVLAIILGDFIGGAEINGQSLVFPVLQRFAQTQSIPVLHYPGIGHGACNRPLPLATTATLQLGTTPSLTVAAGWK